MASFRIEIDVSDPTRFGREAGELRHNVSLLLQDVLLEIGRGADLNASTTIWHRGGGAVERSAVGSFGLQE